MKTLSPKPARAIWKKPALGSTATTAVIILALFTLLPPAAIAGQRLEARVELERGVLAAGAARTAVIKVTLDAPPPPRTDSRPLVNLCLVLDRSGSMSGTKLEKAKEAAIEALRRLGTDDIFAVVFYDHNVNTVVPAQHARLIEGIEGRIRGVRSGGNTALFAGVSQGAAEVRKNLDRKYVPRIVLLSDGIANVGPSTPEDLGRLGAALIKENISVTTVGVGTDYNEDLMTRLSQNSDGNSYFVESSRDLPRIFAAELGDVLSVVARKVHVTVDFPADVRPLKIIGRQGRIRGQQVELTLNQLYGNQEKYALLEVQLPAGRHGQQLEVARVRATYQDPFTLKNETTAGKLLTRYSRDRVEVKRSANVKVLKEVQLNLHAIAQEKAIRLSDEGRANAASEELKKSAAKLKSFAAQHDDPDVLQKAAEIEEEATRIQQQGMSPKSRKKLRTDSYQIKNQQKTQ